MTADANIKAEIVVDLCIPTAKPIRVSSHDAFIVDDLIQRACELVGVPPTFRYLAGLYDKKQNVYLIPEDTVGGNGKDYELQIRIRYHPAAIYKLMNSPTPTIDLYYHQLRYCLLNGYAQRNHSKEVEHKLFGLLVSDYVRQLVEKDEKPEGKTVDDLMESSFPSNCKFPWWKRHIVGKEFMQSLQHGYKECNNSLPYIKCTFIEAVWSSLEEFRQEKFGAQVIINGTPRKCDVVVGQMSISAEADGPGLRIDEADSKDMYPISQLCYLNLDGQQVEMHITNKQPINVILDDRLRVRELLTLLDGYYRMTEKFMASLCGQLQNPMTTYLKKNRIHGPISAAVAQRKLLDNESRQGCYLVRQSDIHYRTYVVELILPDGRIEARTVIETANGNYRLDRDNEESAFKTISSLVKARLRPGNPELYQLPPSEYDNTGLQFCRPLGQPDEENAEERDNKDPPAVVLRVNQIRLDSSLRATLQQKVMQGRFGKKSVVIRFINEISYQRSFLNKADQVLTWRSREIVPILGIIIVSPIGLVSEYMPLGSLDIFLKQKPDELSIGDLGDASLCLAKAVWYLEENGLVHGKIRCRSAFVAECARSSFKVKLGEPGVLAYDERDIPWVAPEYLSVMSSVAYSLKADLYALGTTIWEIFNCARDPFELVAMDDARSFFAAGKRLSLVDVPQEFCEIVADCWCTDPDERRSPRSIVRDIHQLLYQIYQPKKFNTYADLSPSFKLAPPVRSPEPPEIPPLRTVPPRPNEALQRRPSTTSQMSIASHRNWWPPLFRQKKEYDTFSNVTTTSAAPSERTAITETTDAECRTDIYVDDPDDDFADATEGFHGEWIIEKRDLRIGNPLGQGFFGMVFKASLTRFSGMVEEQVAVKRMKSSVQEFSQKDLEREIEIMKKLRHPNIVEIKGIVEEPEVLLVMEYLELGSLQSYLQLNKDNLEHAQLIKYGYDIANGMAYLERKRIIHRDLAARNILVKSESSVKISDFGLAHIVDKEYYMIQTMHRNLPIKWYAPESILYGKFSIKSDVWSYGVALWEMFSFGEDPMPAECVELAHLGDQLMEGHRLALPPGCPADVYQIMRECWRLDHNLRPTFVTLLSMMRNLSETTGAFDRMDMLTTQSCR